MAFPVPVVLIPYVLTASMLTLPGKSVLCSQVIYELRSTTSVVAHYVHNYSSSEYTRSGSGQSGRIIRSLISQIVRQRRDLAGFVYNDYLLQGLEATFRILTDLLINLVSADTDTSIVVDGLDECMDKETKKILDLIPGLTNVASGSRCKVMVFSRNIPIIQKSLRNWPLVALREEKQAVDSAISLWLHAKLQDFQTEHDDLIITQTEMQEIERQITAKADGVFASCRYFTTSLTLAIGMFLWVRLLLSTLEHVHSAYEFQQAVQSLPPGLEEA